MADTTTARSFASVEELMAAVGTRVGTSPWVAVTQAMIDAFADVTGDHQWIHVDVERAKRESPYGGPIAHGLLTLSLLPQMIGQVVNLRPLAAMTINYGFDRVRYISGVPAGSQVRATFDLQSVEPASDGLRLSWLVEVQVKDAPKLAVSAVWLSRVVIAR